MASINEFASIGGTSGGGGSGGAAIARDTTEKRQQATFAPGELSEFVTGDDDGLVLTVMSFFNNDDLFHGIGLACRRFEELAWKCVKPTVLHSGSLRHSLECAAQLGCTRAVERMIALSRNYPLFVASPERCTVALLAACRRGHAAVVRLLLDDRRADPAYSNDMATKRAAQDGRTEVLRMLLDDGRADPAADDNTALKLAVAAGSAGCVGLLLANTRVAPDDRTLDRVLKTAAKHGHVDALRILLDYTRADLVAIDNEVLGLAIEYAQVECVRVLLADARVDPTAENNLALRSAVEYDNAAIVQLLLADRRVKASGAGHQRCFYDACVNGFAPGVRMLLADAHVDPAANSNSAFIEACKWGRTEVVRLLLADLRVDPTAMDNEGRRQAEQGGFDEVESLLDAHADGDH